MPEITLLTKTGGPLTKCIRLDESGKLQSDGSACLMSRGEATRTNLADVTELGALIGSLDHSQAIALGMLRQGLPEKIGVATKRAINGHSATFIARSASNIIYRQGLRGFALIDFDAKGIPPVVAGNLDRWGGLWEALLRAVPALKGAATVTRASTSAGLSRIDTGAAVPGSNGLHVYLGIRDAADAVRFLQALHARCWLNGLGWMMVGAGGQMLERSIVDRMVGAPERLVFEGPPILIEPLVQVAKARRPKVVEGEWLDTIAACPPLSIAEQSTLAELRAKAKHELAGDAAKAREEFIELEAAKIVKRTGATHRAAREIVRKQCDGVLLPSVMLPFDDPALDGKSAADVLADPAAFEGETLADPLEGADYGRCKAKIMRRADGSVWIHSFAHGRTVYDLKIDAAAIREAISRVEKDEVVGTFLDMLSRADLDQVDEESLIAHVHQLSGAGIRAIQRRLKTERQAQSQQRQAHERERRLAERNDPRPQMEEPDQKAPFIPVMDAWNSVLSRSTDPVPPARNFEGDLVCIRKRDVAGTHAFISANEDSDTTQAPPSQWVIHTLTPDEIAEMLERHIDLVDQKGQSVHFPNTFVRHYQNRDDGALPSLVAVATLPLVDGNGHLVSADGLDRRRGIAFNIGSGLLRIIPARRNCTREATGAALRFLIEDWLGDVATDFAGKCTLVCLALTTIERSLLDERPAFFVTAGQRGSGKTTALRMVLEVVTGIAVSAAAWSPSEEERRKSLMGYLMSGVPYILWDNISRGAQISCPHIERALTAPQIDDRKLGVTETVRTSAATIQAFTGNNINPKGDLASRTLQTRLDVDRADPENRKFRHPDPLGWTHEHRNEILRAFYVILLGNPTLDLPRDAPMKTRFKTWYRLIGSAVEHAAKCEAWTNPNKGDFQVWEKLQVLDFERMFLDHEAEDEESSSLAEALAAIEEIAGSSGIKTFSAAWLAEKINLETHANPTLTAAVNVVRAFLFPDASGSKHLGQAVGQRLKQYVNTPVRCDDGTTRKLARINNSHTKNYDYTVVIPPEKTQ